MSEEVKKVSNEHLELIKFINDRWNLLMKKYGEIHFQERMVIQEKGNIERAFDELTTKRTELVNQIQEQFGVTGIVNIKDGTFIPDK